MNIPLRAVLDTDTYNEVDDQFALAHLLMSPDRVRLDAVYAAPFFNHRSTSPEDGMERSFEEIHRVLDLVKAEVRPPVYRGSTRYLPGARVPVESEAVDNLIERALACTTDKLYVVAIAAATNVASALLKEPKIADHIVVVWLGGDASYWPHTREFNLEQDPHAARILLDENVPLVHVPCYPVSSHLITTVAELEARLAPFSRLGAYLTDVVRDYAGNPPGWSKQIWDIAASAWVINPEWVKTQEEPSPLLGDDLTWKKANGRRAIRIATQLHRDAIFADFFAKAAKQGK
jgi:hypothetical protein